MIWQNWKRNVIGDFPLRSIIHWIGCIRTRTSFSQYLGELDVDDEIHGIDDDVHGVDDDVQGVDDDVNDGEGCVLIEMLRAPQSLVVPHVRVPHRPRRFPCSVPSALSWNPNGNPSTYKLSRAINYTCPDR